MGLNVRKTEDPPVVFIAQLGTGGDSWKPVLELLSSGTTAVTYDRPGTGSASPRPAPNPPLPYSGFARELADLLDAQGVTAPAVIVGHSIGGLIARAYAALRPDRVAGLVVVDGSIPQFHLTADGTADGTSVFDGDEPSATEVDVVAGQAEILQVTPPRVPVLVLTRMRHWWTGGFQNIPHPAIDDLWFVSQQILARDTNAVLIVSDAGHQIPAERPGLVAYAIDQVVDAIRRGGEVALDTDRLRALGGGLDGAAAG